MKITCAILGVVIWAGLARAGIYNTAEEQEITLSPNIFKFRETLLAVRSIGFPKVDFDNPLRKRYMLWEALAGSTPPANLTLEQKLDYSAVLLRRKKFQQAIDFLTPLSRQHPEIFLFESHLAMAYWSSGQQGNERRALEIQNQLLTRKVWPEDYADLSEPQREFFQSIYWSEHEFGVYRKMELQLLKLMKLRSAEPPGGAFEAVDALFDDGQKPAKAVKFVNEKGTFEPGKIAVAERKKLPNDAREIVQQLLLWLPEDIRLYWLLGEIANVQGTPDNLQAAGKIIDELVYDFKLRAGDIRDRRQILLDHLASLKPASPTLDEFDNTLKKVEQQDGAVKMDFRTLAVTFATGLAVGIFALWQLQEFRRRRRGGAV